MSRYCYEDISRLPLSDEFLLPFLKDLSSHSHAGIGQAYTLEPDALRDKIKQILHLSILVLEDYKSTPEYLLADNNQDRAKIAMEAKIVGRSKDKVLQMWLKYADQMSEFEKVMMGWDK